MKYYLLVVKNHITFSIDDDIQKFVNWVKRHTDLDVEIEYLETDFELNFKSFGVRNLPGSFSQTVDLWGTTGTKEKLSPLVKKGHYHSVIFIYDFLKSPWNGSVVGRSLGNFTFWEGINSAQYIEMYATESLEKVDELYRVLTHEIIHAWHMTLRSQGIPTSDTMDLYEDEFIVESPTGNRTKNLAVIKPYLNVIGKLPRSREIVQVLSWFIKDLATIESLRRIIMGEEAPKKESRLTQWAEAIKEFEGWYVGSRSYRNNNPGNLRWSKYQIGMDGGFSLFKTYADGFKALLFQLEIAATGKSKVYKQTMTLLEFFQTYAPSTDNNHPETYAKFVANKLNTSISTQIKELT